MSEKKAEYLQAVRNDFNILDLMEYYQYHVILSFGFHDLVLILICV